MTWMVLGLVLIAAFLHALWNLAAKKVSGNLSVLWLGLCLASIVSWPFALSVYQPAQFIPETIGCILATGALHTAYFIALAKAYASGEISLVYPVARGTGVAGTALLASLWLSESITLYGTAGIGAICLGTALIGVDRTGHKHPVSPILYALLVGLTISGYSVVDKLAVGTLHPTVYISSMFSLTTLGMYPYVWWHQVEFKSALRGLKRYIALIGIGSIGTYLIILFAFRFGPASYVVAARESAVVIGALLGRIFLLEPLTPNKVLGIVAIVCGVILVKAA
ncbi:MAG: hypothetical protein ETSY1_35330 [Candidatus Entotheonella factor]|uniref:EamA domain-containing protein n=1 Tax=Entotheonella factor TaxID=1429438 RepID=W4L8Y2_ENTF1|nr:DMT family transporter [Candidatus Entotheonella palauensis]ETW94334.1 MAG: hypothetical protein ETSY1_35330 [Candidatus Entotheonella factor]